jgi:hypothetical protein
VGTVRFDLVGKKFNRLTVIEFLFVNKHRKSVWKCVCDCGNEVHVLGSKLVSNYTNSCGCYKSDRIKESKTTHGHSARQTKEYKAWKAMLRRCKVNPLYKLKRITVCKRWQRSFVNFLQDMKECPAKDSTLDRIDNAGNYSKKNCRWASQKQQMRNVSTNRIIKFNNEFKCLAEWCELLKLNYHKVKKRLNRGWSVHRAFAA